MIPTSLCITIKTNLNQNPINYKSSNTLHGHKSNNNSVASKPLFNPFVKMTANQLAKIPKERQPAVFFSIDEFNRMMESLRSFKDGVSNIQLDASGSLLDISSKTGVIDNNIQLTLDTLFPLGGVFYDEFGDEYTIVGCHWDKGNWMMNMSMVPNLDDFGIGRPFDKYNIATFNPNDIKALIAALPEDAQKGRSFISPKPTQPSLYSMFSSATSNTTTGATAASNTTTGATATSNTTTDATTTNATDASNTPWTFLNGIFGPNASTQSDGNNAPKAATQTGTTAAQSKGTQKNTIYQQLFGENTKEPNQKISIYTTLLGNKSFTLEEYINTLGAKMRELIAIAERRLESTVHINMWHDICANRDTTYLTAEQQTTCSHIDVKNLKQILDTNTQYWIKANNDIKELYNAIQQNKTPELDEFKTNITELYSKYRETITNIIQSHGSILHDVIAPSENEEIGESNGIQLSNVQDTDMEFKTPNQSPVANTSSSTTENAPTETEHAPTETENAPTETESPKKKSSVWDTLSEFAKDMGGLNSPSSVVEENTEPAPEPAPEPEPEPKNVSSRLIHPLSTPDEILLSKMDNIYNSGDDNIDNWNMSEEDTDTHFSNMIEDIHELEAQLATATETNTLTPEIREKYTTAVDLLLNEFDRFEHAPNINTKFKQSMYDKFSQDIIKLNKNVKQSAGAITSSSSKQPVMGGPFYPDKYAMAAPFIYPYPWGYQPQHEQPKRRVYTDKIGVCYVVPITLELHRGKLNEADLKRLPCYNKKKNIAENFNTLVGSKIMMPQFRETIEENPKEVQSATVSAPPVAPIPIPMPMPIPPDLQIKTKKGGSKRRHKRHGKNTRKRAQIKELAKVLHYYSLST